MLVLTTTAGAAARSPTDLHGRLEELGVYRRERRPWLPHVTVLRFRERPRLDPPCPRSGGSRRPMPLLSFPVCTRPERGTRCSNRLR